MKALVEVGSTGVWLDPAQIATVFESDGATQVVLIGGVPLTIHGATVADVLAAVERAGRA